MPMTNDGRAVCTEPPPRLRHTIHKIEYHYLFTDARLLSGAAYMRRQRLVMHAPTDCSTYRRFPLWRARRTV